MSAIGANTTASQLTRLWRALSEPVGRLSHHWFIFFLLVQFPFLAVWGAVGVLYGLPLHFREDQSLVELANGPYRQALIIFNSPSFFTHAFTTFFAGLFWLTAAVINPEDGPLFRRLSRLDETRYLAVRILPVSAIMLYAAAFPISDVVPPVRGMELLRCALGVGLGLLTFEAYALLSRLVASKFGFKRGHVLLVLLVCLIFLLHFFPKLLTGMKDNKLTGAIIVQLNAFPVLSDKSVNADATKQPYDDCAESAPYEGADPFGWLLSPFEGLTSARERSMLFRSELALGALKEIYAKDDLKLTRVAFENAARSSLSWYLPKANLDCMRTELENAQNAQAFESVARAWSGAGGDFDWPIR